MTEAIALQEPQIIDGGVIEQITLAEVDSQVSTAKKYPRSLQTFRQEAMALACQTPEIAQSCFYVLPRGGTNIEGPSVRLAEIVAVTWGNLRCETRVVATGDKTITAQATAWDMQRNVLIRCETSRRITSRDGKRYNDDMIIMTGNAAAAIALRNAIFKVVPMAYVKEIYGQCKRIAISEDGGVDAARKRCVTRLVQMGAREKQIFELIGVEGLPDIGLDDITAMQGLITALEDGTTTIDQTFPPEPMKEGKGRFGFRKKAEPAEKPKKPKKTAKKEAAPPEEPPPPTEEDVGPPPMGDGEDPWDKHLPETES